MDWIRGWATAICMGALAAALAQMLAPSGALQKIFKVAVAAFFLCCFLSPFFNSDSLPEFSLPDEPISVEESAQNLKQEMHRQLQDQVEVRLKQLSMDATQKVGITPEKILIHMDTDADGSISIKQIDVVLKDEDQKMKGSVRSAIQETLGFTPRVLSVSEVKTS
ncbi:stage III sporulation protein AF [Solibaculum mannosilyticum]|uniref:Stage III sporulation protein AF n=1 Tax=Solibaculum mannosilyticum TaxID=2780922 RepID=A0A7I8D151_9FIRM|nr:stage III sporulation protein AF [Solibaculum mannosilyticum]BCI60510.1 hypothetical protein C12CBH8_11490 [Solibaculum mannosilyticum]